MEIVTLVVLGVLVAEVSFLVYVTTKRKPIVGGRKVFVDTSALMDGRIVTAARTGFIPDKLVVPSSVVAELQLLADQADGEKRARARRGLDAVNELQEIEGVSVTILDDGPVGEGGVDARLVELAKKQHDSFLCTIDFNLNKVATINGVTVLNINELAGSIRMAFLPGETMSLALTQKGQSENQAVGYLADGTMVVVDKAGKDVGRTVQIEFIRSLQTAAGRMMFAKKVSSTASDEVKSSDQVQRKATNKSVGRKPATDTQSKVNDSPAKKTPRRKPSRASASSREDSLLDLVNNQ